MPFDWFSDNPYFRLNKLLLSFELFDAMDSLESFFTTFSTIYRMIKQIIYILLLIHVFACLLFAFSNNNFYFARHGNLLLPSQPEDPNLMIVQTMMQSGPGEPGNSLISPFFFQFVKFMSILHKICAISQKFKKDIPNSRSTNMLHLSF